MDSENHYPLSKSMVKLLEVKILNLIFIIVMQVHKHHAVSCIVLNIANVFINNHKVMTEPVNIILHYSLHWYDQEMKTNVWTYWHKAIEY